MTREELPLDSQFRAWVAAASGARGYPTPPEDWFEQVYERLPAGLRTAIVAGIENGAIKVVNGFKFMLDGLPAGKGPYTWLEDFRKEGRISPCWEYFAQAAEYVRVRQALASGGYRVTAEDRLMDIAVYDGEDLAWYIEVKERADDLDGLAKKIADQGAKGVDLGAADRGNDALRKAKALISYRPRFFSLAAIGKRLDYSVDYEAASNFALTPDLVPLA